MKRYRTFFNLMGREFAYHSHPYNRTRINERAVEVPIGLHLLNQSVRALEVGAVLPHYQQPVKHTCIDLTEVLPSVINADVLTYEPKGKFDLVLSISTLDHLKSAEQVQEAVERMRSWLTENGLLYISLPFGQPSKIGGGPWLDELVLSGVLQPDRLIRMDKTSPKLNTWEQVEDMEQEKLAYNGPSEYANTVFLLFWGNLDAWW